MALGEGALKQISECDGPSQLEQRLGVVKVFHLVGVLGEQFSGVDRLGNVAQGKGTGTAYRSTAIFFLVIFNTYF